MRRLEPACADRAQLPIAHHSADVACSNWEPNTGLPRTNTGLLEDSPRRHEIRRFKALGKPAVNGSEEIMGSSDLPAIEPQPRKFQSRAQLERQRGLLRSQ